MSCAHMPGHRPLSPAAFRSSRRKTGGAALSDIFQAISDVLVVHEAAVSPPAAQRLEGLGDPRRIIKPGEALHPGTPNPHRESQLTQWVSFQSATWARITAPQPIF